MLDYQTEILDFKLPYLLENLTLDDTFLAHVRAEKLLSEESIEDVQAKETETGKIVTFIEKLRKQAPEKFNVFMGILKSTDQKHVYKVLHNMKLKKISKLPKSPEIEKNVKEKLHSTFLPHRRLSTKDIEDLAKNFVLREDYVEVNEDKHNQIQENRTLESKLKVSEEQAKYEMEHHKIVKTENKKLEKSIKELEAERTELQRKVNELQREVKQHEDQQKEHLSRIDSYANEVEFLENMLQEKQIAENKRKGSHMKESSYDTTDDSAPFTAVHTEMSKAVAEFKQYLQDLTNTSVSIQNTTEHFQKIKEELVDLQECVTDALNSLGGGSTTESHSNLEDQQHSNNDDFFGDAPYGRSITHDDVDFGDQQTLGEATDPNNNNGEKVTTEVTELNSQVDRTHTSHKPKRSKNHYHSKQRNRVITIETELKVLKDRIKQMENDKTLLHEQLQQRDKQLREEERQIVKLRQQLRPQQREQMAMRKLQQPTSSSTECQAHNHYQAFTTLQTMSYQPSAQQTYSERRYQNLANISPVALGLNANCLHTSDTNTLPRLSTVRRSHPPEYSNRFQNHHFSSTARK